MAVAIDHVEIIQAPSILTDGVHERDEQISDSDVSTMAMDSASMDESDSGIMSWVDLPGVDLSGEEFTDEFVTKPIQLAVSEHSYESYLSDLGWLNELPLSTDFSLPPPPPSNKRRASLRRRRSSMISIPASFPQNLEDDSIVPQELEEPTECIVCLQTITFNTQLVKLECCNNDLCMDCMKEFITVRVTEGLTYIPCPNPECTKAFTHSTIAKYIKDKDIRNKYERFRLNTEEDGSKKTCPNCCFITERSDLPPFNPKKKSSQTPHEYMISCEECSFKWCFNCHSPWHEGLSCVSYRKGDKLFVNWTKGRKTGYTPNCQRCPKCKVYIERSTGCDSMTCNRCHANFCYKCGGKFRNFPGLGNHYKKLSVFGCPYRYLPEQGAKRKLVRGGYLFAKCAAATGFPILLVGGVAVVVAGAVVIVPIAGGIVGTLLIRKKIRGY